MARKKIMKDIGFTQEQFDDIRIHMSLTGMTFQEVVSQAVDEKLKAIEKLKLKKP